MADTDFLAEDFFVENKATSDTWTRLSVPSTAGFRGATGVALQVTATGESALIKHTNSDTNTWTVSPATGAVSFGLNAKQCPPGANLNLWYHQGSTTDTLEVLWTGRY